MPGLLWRASFIHDFHNDLTAMTSPGGIDKWVQFELTRVNRGLVTRKKKLSALLKEEKPQCTTKEGESYDFDRHTLELLASALGQDQDLSLPITVYFSSKSQDQSYIDDETATEVIRRLEGFKDAYQYRDGRMWLPNSLAYSLIQKYRTVFQGVFL